jgi:hypothetical protein
MTEPELALRILKAIVEVVGFAYMGQAILVVFAGGMRESNLFYRIFRVVTDPVTRATRFLMPRFMPDRHIPWIAFGLLLWLWFFIILGIVYVRRVAGA